MTARPDLSLDQRSGLPDALQVLLRAHPRAGWTADPGFQGLVQFWLSRHQMFRQILDVMEDDARLFLDRRRSPEAAVGRLRHFGQMFVQELHGHHQIEDHHYFPILAAKDPRLLRGFTILDQDHHALDGHLDDFTRAANLVIAAGPNDAVMRDAVARFRPALAAMTRLLDRHLTDEEDLIVPVILRHGAEGID